MKNHSISHTTFAVLIALVSVVGCGSETDSATQSPDFEVRDCSGLEDGDCQALRSIEADVPLADFGDDPCSIGFEYSNDGFDDLAVACEDGRVIKLGLHDVGLTSIPEKMFEGLDGLEALSLGGNKIEEIDARVFESVPQLRDLFLFENVLTELPEGLLSGLPQLKILAVERNKITSIPTSFFSKNPLLETVQINDNAITELSAAHFADMDNLTTLFMGANELTSIESDLFSGAPNLTYLVLSSNQISNYPSGLFADHEDLVRVGLNSNEATFSEGIFGDSERALELLDVKCNGPLPADFTKLTVTEKLVIGEDQAAQPELSEWVAASPAEIEADC